MSLANDGKHLSDQLTPEGIPAIRKHIYFYVLLFLGTVVTNNIWTQLMDSSAPAPEVAAVVEMKQVATTAQKLTP